MTWLGGGAGRAAGEVARAVLAAIVAGRVAEVLALVDRDVVCMPVTRPARVLYEGHAGMARLVEDLHAVYGMFRVEAEDVTGGAGAGAEGGGGTVVTLLLRVVAAERGGGPWPPALTEFTVRDGLVTCIESKYSG
jgi:hypothetical protein